VGTSEATGLAMRNPDALDMLDAVGFYCSISFIGLVRQREPSVRG